MAAETISFDFDPTSMIKGMDQINKRLDALGGKFEQAATGISGSIGKAGAKTNNILGGIS